MSRSQTKWGGLLLLMLVAGVAIGALLAGSLRVGSLFGRGPDPVTVAGASLESMREQQRLTAFSAQFVAVVTSRQQRFGLSAEKTLILPGTVRYEVDLARLGARDLRWDARTSTLSVTLPPVEPSAPAVDLDRMREYGSDGLLMRLTSAEQRLDQSNIRAGQAELARQAGAPLPMRLAREAARSAVARNFAMPLRAAGMQVAVSVRFADEPASGPSILDRSRSVEDVLAERR